MSNRFHTLLPFLLMIAVITWTASAVDAQTDNLYRISNSLVKFDSDAPLEIIKASNNDMSGLLDPKNGSFALSIPIRSFFGFNSPLQTEHFNENYMESHKYRSATFSGRIIEDVDYGSDGEHSVRAKGALTIHGVKKERIIPCKLIIRDNEIAVSAEFAVLLRDHNISIPKIVEQKIASEINVVTDATFVIEKTN